MKGRKAFFLNFAVLLLLAGCTIRIIAPYDDVTDTRINELHETILLQLKKWDRMLSVNSANPAVKYEANVDFYDEVKTALEILIDRNKAIEQNKIVIEQLENALSIMKDMEELHQLNGGTGMKKATIESTRGSVKLAMGAIQKLQMELKNAEEK